MKITNYGWSTRQGGADLDVMIERYALERWGARTEPTDLRHEVPPCA
jgi:hypothetical protein